MRVIFTIAASVALAAAASAHAQVYPGELPAPAYAEGAYDYARDGESCRDGFTLAGARAGVTVLGLDIDARAGLRVGSSAGCRHRERAPPYAPAPVYSPSYAPQYSPPPGAADVEPGYAYPYPVPAPCDCASTPYRPPSRYGW